MNHIKKILWDKMKDAVSGNSLTWQYEETGSTYQIFASNTDTCLHYQMLKTTPKSPEQIDWEDNFKSAATKW